MATYAGRYDEPMLRRVNGRLGVATGISVRVYEDDGTTVATLYTDRTKATTADNPVDVDASGNLEFFADPGTYVLSILESDAQVATNVVTVFTDPAESAAAGHDHDADYATAAQGALADTALQDAADVIAEFTGTPDGTQYLRDDGTLATPPGGGDGASDHGALTGLADDDHTQYALADGSRGSFEASGAVAAHTGDVTDAHDASAISITDAGTHYAATDVEAALQEVPTLISNATSDAVSSTDVDTIVVLTQAAYDALTPVATTLYVISG